MEDVLELYAQEPEAGKARICFDERPCQLLNDVVEPLSMKEGKPAKQDYEYGRNGTAVILLAYDIGTGQRYVQVRKRRTKEDYAQFMEWLAKEHYQHVEQIELVQDNLNTQLWLILRKSTCHLCQRTGPQVQLPFYAKAWEMAQYGRNRIICVGKGMPEQENWQYRGIRKRGANMV